MARMFQYFLIRDRIMKCSHTEYRDKGFHQKMQTNDKYASILMQTCDEESSCVGINCGKPREMLANLKIMELNEGKHRCKLKHVSAEL